MMVIMQEPQESMHQVLMCTPSNAFHNKEGQQHHEKFKRCHFTTDFKKAKLSSTWSVARKRLLKI